eukprot:11109827-Prorocentrum_lima.AAC.1
MIGRVLQKRSRTPANVQKMHKMWRRSKGSSRSAVAGLRFLMLWHFFFFLLRAFECAPVSCLRPARA